MVFSNSLIIHKERTKKITTVTVVWNYRKILQTLSLNFSKNYCSFEKLVLKNSAAPRFSTHFSVSGYRMKHCVSFQICYIKNEI